VGDSVYFGWSLNKSTDAFGNSIQYAYHRDTVQGINYPLEVTYGNGGDARIEFQYGTRTDAPPQPLQPGEIDQEQLVLLHHINVYLDGKLLREYRLITEEEPANPEEDHYRRLKQTQLCAYDDSGLSSDCLNPLVFNWLEPEGANPLDFKTGIGEVIDGLGKSTRFYHALISENPTDVQFGERPFGEGILPADASELQPVDGEYRYVVGEVHRSNGFADGWHITSYSYQGVGLVSSQNWGFLGYYAQKAHDQQSDIVTYRQFRLDFPHFGETARVQQYLGNSDDYLQKLSDQKFRFGETALAVNGNTTYYTYPAESLETVYEQDQVIGYRYNSSNYSKSAPGSTGEILDSGTRTQKVVTEASVSDAQTFWGEVQTISTSGVVRSQKAVTSYLNRTSPWLVGFVEAQEVSDFNGDTNTAADRVQTLIATPFGNSNNIGSVTRFPGDPNYELIVSYNYDGNGNVSGETTSGVNIDTRSLSATSYIDKRYPATITNALSQNITISYDSRFGSAKNVTDANNRTTTIGYDPFGREVTRTNPDGVVFDTDYTACSGGSCPVYGNMLAAYRVTTNSPITPTADRYYDLLGRIVQQDIASFNGSTVSRREYNYDNQGRLYLETAPYFDGQYKPLTIYEYDVRDRIVKVDRPDNSEVRTTFTALLASNQVQVAIAEDVYDADGAYLETHTKQRLFNLAGDLVKTIDAVGTGKEVTTAFTYNGSGLALSAMVDNSPATKSTFVYDKAGYRISLTDPNLGTVTSAYDAFGQLAGQIDNKGQAISYLYDKLGRLAEQTDADGVASWIYDPANAIGQLAERSYADGGVQVFRETYNYSSAKLQSITTDLAADGYSRSYQHSYGYDGYGRLERVTYPSNAEAYYQYNSNGYLEQITDGSNPLKTRNSVNALGYAEEEVYGNNLVTTRSYNPQTGQLESISTAGASHIQNNEYRWRSNGTLQSRLLVDGGVSKLESFSYDALNRLTSAATYFDGVAQRTLTTQYDKLGNILSKSSSHPSDTNVTGYQYGQGGNAGPNAVSQASIGGVAHNLYYDANGAITRYDAASGDDKWITWNARQLPVEITLGESQSTQTPTARDRFQYGPNGQRFYRETSWLDENQQLQTERAFYVGKYEDLLPANDPDYQRVQKARIDSNIVHIAATDHPGITVGTLEYLHRDHLGSIDKVTDEAGVVILNTAFDPFGKRRNAGWQSEIQAQELKELLENQGLTTKRGFTGHEHLDRTGLIHMNGRIYDPQLGRFLSPDPFVQAPANSQSWNRYSYVMNAPLERTDPSGYTSIRSFYDLGGGGGGGFDGWPVNVIGSPITADWNEFKGGYGSSGSGGSFGGNPGNDRGGSSGSASGGNQSEDKDTEKAKEQANVSPNGTTYEDEVVVTATKEGSGTSGFKSCLASCLQINYGETYEWAESVSPVSVQGFLTNEAAEALHDKALREANRNAWQASNQKAFETGMRQLSVVKLFARFNAAAAVAGAGAAGFQVGALGYCSVECVGE
jgi:RHS repeat-associated protein